MPFVISHGPDMNAVGSVALQTGNAAYFNQVRREREAQAMAERQQRRAIYASLVQQGLQIRAMRERQVLDQDFSREQQNRHENFQWQMRDAVEQQQDARQQQQQAFMQRQALESRQSNQDFQLRLQELQQKEVNARHKEEMAADAARLGIQREQLNSTKEWHEYSVASQLYDQEAGLVGETEDLIQKGWGFRDGGNAWQAWNETRKKILDNDSLRGRQRAEALLMHARKMPHPDVQPEPDVEEIIDNQLKWIQDEDTGRRFPVTVRKDKDGLWDVQFPTGWQNFGQQEGGNTQQAEAEQFARYQELAAKQLQPRGEFGEPPTPEQINEYARKLAAKDKSQAGGAGGAGASGAGNSPTRFVQPKIRPADFEQQIEKPTELTDEMLKNPKQLKVGQVYGPRYDSEVEQFVLYQWNGRDFDRIAPWNK